MSIATINGRTDIRTEQRRIGRAIARALATDLPSVEQWCELLNELPGRAQRNILRTLQDQAHHNHTIHDVRRCYGEDTFHSHEDGEDINGRWYSRDHIGSHFCTCDDCNELVRIDDTQSVDGNTICDCCIRNNYTRCEDCSEWALDEDVSNVAGDIICRSCLENGEYYYHEGDGEYHREPEEEEDDGFVRYPDEGPCQRQSRIWKELVALIGKGKQTIELPSGELSEAGKMELLKILWALPDDTSGQVYSVAARWMEGQEPLLWHTKEGSLPKRLAKEVKRQTGVKLSNDTLGKIGSLADKHCPKTSQYTFDITETIDWQDGDFGDSGSCYWGCHASARYKLQSQHNAFAIRFYDGRRGMGRAWIVVQDGKAFLFNAYGVNLTTQSRVLAQHLGAQYGELDSLLNQGNDSGDLWINGAKPHRSQSGSKSGGRGFAITFDALDTIPKEWDFGFRF